MANQNTNLRVAIAVWLVLMAGCATMIAALAVDQHMRRRAFLDRDLTPPPYVCTPQDKEAGECQ